MASPVSSSIPIYHHLDPQTTAIPLLRSHLPWSIPLLRRIQHSLAYPSKTARVLTTFPATDTDAHTPPTPWLAAYIDLFRGRQTQIYIYSSLQKDGDRVATLTTLGNGDECENEYFVSMFSNIADTGLLAQIREQLLGLLNYVKANLLEEYLSALSESATLSNTTTATAATTPESTVTSNNNNNNIPRIPPPPPKAFLIGALHTGLHSLLTATGTYTDPDALKGLRIHRFDNPPHVEYLFSPDTINIISLAGEGGASTTMLPPGYRFKDRHGRRGVQSCQFDLVQSRTHIPRSRESLACMFGEVIYYDPSPSPSSSSSQQSQEQQQRQQSAPSDTTTVTDQEIPIAWAFLGYDGALATLHVEPEHRGKGLAVHVSREVLRRGMREGSPFYGGGEDGESEWGHVEVATGNLASRRVMEKIGGRIGWTVTWSVVEIE